MTDSLRPPAHLEVFVEALGVDDAMAFLLLFGGGQLMLGAKPNSANPVVREMGPDVAMRLAAIHDRLPAQIPVGKDWMAQVLHLRGLPVTRIARMLHTTEPTVRRYLGKRKAKRSAGDKVLPLFPDL